MFVDVSGRAAVSRSPCKRELGGPSEGGQRVS